MEVEPILPQEESESEEVKALLAEQQRLDEEEERVSLTEGEFNLLFRTIDANGDGQICYKELFAHSVPVRSSPCWYVLCASMIRLRRIVCATHHLSRPWPVITTTSAACGSLVILVCLFIDIF